MNLFKLLIVTILSLSLMACTTKLLKKEPSKPLLVMNPDKVATFPGCEKHTEKRALLQCLSKQVGRHVRRHFNSDLGSELGMAGRKKIRVQFKIDTNGELTDIKSKASHPKLEQEAVRVIQLLPKMVPAVKDGRNVLTQYALPISFFID